MPDLEINAESLLNSLILAPCNATSVPPTDNPPNSALFEVDDPLPVTLSKVSVSVY